MTMTVQKYRRASGPFAIQFQSDGLVTVTKRNDKGEITRLEDISVGVLIEYIFMGMDKKALGVK